MRFDNGDRFQVEGIAVLAGAPLLTGFARMMNSCHPEEGVLGPTNDPMRADITSGPARRFLAIRSPGDRENSNN